MHLSSTKLTHVDVTEHCMLSASVFTGHSSRCAAQTTQLQHGLFACNVHRPAAAAAVIRQQSGWKQTPSRLQPRHVTAVSKRLLAEIEDLKQKTDAVHYELQEVGKTAEVAAKRSRRLAERSQQLQEYALEHVMLGDEGAARAALLQKASVADALAAASRRAEANSALARKLEQVLQAQQLQLLELIRTAKKEADEEEAAAAAASSPKQGTEALPARQLKRSGSVAWESPTMHASSDGWDHELHVPLPLQQQQQQQFESSAAVSNCQSEEENVAKFPVKSAVQVLHSSSSSSRTIRDETTAPPFSAALPQERQKQQQQQDVAPHCSDTIDKQAAYTTGGNTSSTIHI